MSKRPRPLGLCDEFDLLRMLSQTSSAQARAELVDRLEAMPVRRCSFYLRWLNVHDVRPFHCWDDAGYDSTRSHVPRDVQLLAAANYGHADICNGGFHQFFGNHTGNFAPEMLEWFERADLAATAAVLRSAMTVFGDAWPRSQVDRLAFLRRISGSARSEWDLFTDLDAQFFATLSRDPDAFAAAADRWLRDVCGVSSLRAGAD